MPLESGNVRESATGLHRTAIQHFPLIILNISLDSDSAHYRKRSTLRHRGCQGIFEGGSQQVPLLNRFEELTVERVSGVQNTVARISQGGTGGLPQLKYSKPEPRVYDRIRVR